MNTQREFVQLQDVPKVQDPLLDDISKIQLVKTPYQRFAELYMNINTFATRFFLNWQTGMGKTIGALSISQSFLEHYKNAQQSSGKILGHVYIIGFSADTFRNELMTKPEFGFVEEKDIDHVSELINKIMTTQSAESAQMYQSTLLGLKKRITNTKLGGFYKFIGYKTLANYVEAGKPLNIFDNSLIICDEIHNVYNTNEMNNWGNALLRVLDTAKNIRAVFMSATPLNNSPVEIVHLLNLLRDNMPLVKETDLFKDGQLVRGAHDTIAKYTDGKVSYISGLDPKDYPSFSFVGQDIGIHDLRFIRTKMSKEYLKRYDTVNHVYSHDMILPGITDVASLGLLTKEHDKLGIYYNRATESLHGPFLDYTNIDKYSPKYKTLVDMLHGVMRTDPGKILIYNNYVNVSGTRTIAELLRRNGFIDESEMPNEDTLCVVCAKPMSKHKIEPIEAMGNVFIDATRLDKNKLLDQLDSVPNNKRVYVKYAANQRDIMNIMQSRNMITQIDPDTDTRVSHGLWKRDSESSSRKKTQSTTEGFTNAKKYKRSKEDIEEGFVDTPDPVYKKLAELPKFIPEVHAIWPIVGLDSETSSNNAILERLMYTLYDFEKRRTNIIIPTLMLRGKTLNRSIQVGPYTVFHTTDEPYAFDLPEIEALYKTLKPTDKIVHSNVTNHFREKKCTVEPVPENFTNSKEHAFVPARFILLRDTYDALLKKFNSPNNTNGHRILIAIGSQNVKEGINFKAVRHEFITSRPDNISTLVQIRGRVIRNKSHALLPPEQQNAKVYILTHCYPDGSWSREEEMYNKKVAEWELIKTIETTMYSNAVDSYLNTNTSLDDPLTFKPVVPRRLHAKLSPANITSWTAHYSDYEIDLVKVAIKRLLTEQGQWEIQNLYKAVQASKYATQNINMIMVTKEIFDIALMEIIWQDDSKYINKNAVSGSDIKKLLDPSNKIITDQGIDYVITVSYIGKTIYVYRTLLSSITGDKLRVSVHKGRSVISLQSILADKSRELDRFISSAKKLSVIDIGVELTSITKEFRTSLIKKSIEKITDAIVKNKKIEPVYTKIIFYCSLFGQVRFGESDIVPTTDEMSASIASKSLSRVFESKRWASKRTQHEYDNYHSALVEAVEEQSVPSMLLPIGTDSQVYTASGWKELSDVLKKTKENEIIIGYRGVKDGESVFKLREPNIERYIEDKRFRRPGMVCITKTKKELIELADKLEINLSSDKKEEMCNEIEDFMIKKEISDKEFIWYLL